MPSDPRAPCPAPQGGADRPARSDAERRSAARLDDLLAEILVSRGLVEASHVESWRKDASGSRLTDYLLARGCLTPDALHQSMTAVAERTAAAPGPSRPAGESFGRFVKRERLGAGGFGEVWRAWDPVLDRDVALKILRQTGALDIGRLMEEARIAARLRHPNIVAIHEIGKDEKGTPFIVMDFIDGSPMSKLRLPTPRLLEAVRDAAKALAVAHEQGLVHRDVKPDNLLLDAAGRAYVADFGLARAAAAEGEVAGTPKYMAPEQARGEPLDARADVYGLGATLYWGLTARAPAEGKTVGEVLRQVLKTDPPRPRAIDPHVPIDVEAICLKAIEKERALRYATAADLAADIGRYLKGDAVLARRATWAYRAGKRLKKNPLLFAAAAVALLATLTVGAIVVGRYATSRSALAEARREETAGNLEEALEQYSRSASLWETAEAGDGATRTRNALDRRAADLARRQQRDRIAAYYRRAFWEREGFWRRIEGVGIAHDDAADEDRRAWIAEADGLVEEGRGEILAVWARLMLAPDAEAEASLNRLADAARGGVDPMPLLLRARWNLQAYIREFQLPAVAMGAVQEALEPTWSETEDMRTRGEAASADLAAAGEIGLGGDERWTVAADRVRSGFQALLQGSSPAATPEAADALASAGGTTGWMELRRLAGLARIISGDYEGGAAEWRRALDDHPRWRRLWDAQATALLLAANRRGREGQDPLPCYAEAIEATRRASAVDPRDADALARRADAFRLQADAMTKPGEDAEAAYRAAIAEYSRAIEIDPEEPTAWQGRGVAHVGLARLLVRTGGEGIPEYQEGVNDLGKAAELDRTNAFPFFGLADALREIGTTQAAIGEDPLEAYGMALRAYNAGLSLRPDWADALINRAVTRNAVAVIAESRGTDPREIYRDAVDDLSRVLDRHVDCILAWSNRGAARRSLAAAMAARGDDAREVYRGSIADLTRALEARPGDAGDLAMRGRARHELATHLRSLGEDPSSEYAAAETDYQAALEARPGDWETLANLGLLNQEQERWHEALTCFEAALAIQPTHPRLRALAEEARRHLQKKTPNPKSQIPTESQTPSPHQRQDGRRAPCAPPRRSATRDS